MNTFCCRVFLLFLLKLLFALLFFLCCFLYIPTSLFLLEVSHPHHSQFSNTKTKEYSKCIHLILPSSALRSLLPNALCPLGIIWAIVSQICPETSITSSGVHVASVHCYVLNPTAPQIISIVYCSTHSLGLIPLLNIVYKYFPLVCSLFFLKVSFAKEQF